MKTFLLSLIVFPLIGFLLSLIISKKNEQQIFRISIVTSILQLAIGLILCGYLLIDLQDGFLAPHEKFRLVSGDYELSLQFYFDHVSAVFILVGATLMFLITKYSKYYLHREEGYKRFFNTILFFYFGYNLIVLSGNFLTLLIGWEILGLSSFLLISFYRERYLPVRNAFKVFSLYRLSDIFLILVIWLSHYLWHQEFSFSSLNNLVEYNPIHEEYFYSSLVMAILIVVSASIKSAQFPFSSWLPRAMEGPTSSSAIFYSSLSVHIGVFVLLRTYPFWSDFIAARILVVAIGFISSVTALFIANVQSTAKSQIAYSSIVQIGIVFIEVAFGFEQIALIHFMGNAFLRTYQLLVSPSTVVYLVREQIFKNKPNHKNYDGIMKKIMNSLYILSIKEWHLDSFQYKYLWNPFKKLGRLTTFLDVRLTLWTLLLAYIGSCLIFVYLDNHMWMYRITQTATMFVAFALSLWSFTERRNAMLAFLLIAFSHFWILNTVAIGVNFNLRHTIIYLSGVSISLFLGYVILSKIRIKEKQFSMNQFNGYVHDYKWHALLFFLASIGISGFPITPTFLGNELLFSHLRINQIDLIFMLSITSLFLGLSSIRIYARLFLGPPHKTNLPAAHRSS